MRQILSCLLVVLLLACSEAARPDEGAVFEVMACRESTHAPDGERFRVRILDPIVIEQAAARVGKGQGLIVTGYTRDGDGGFNQPWTWHLDPGSVRFAEVTMELCDGCPTGLVAGVQFCPWSTEVLRRLQ
jgi:hypothetical protein